jgi:hypothetical protein
MAYCETALLYLTILEMGRYTISEPFCSSISYRHLSVYVQWVPRVLSPGVKRGRAVKLITHPRLVPRPWLSRSYTSSLPCAAIGVLWDCITFYLSIYTISIYLFPFLWRYTLVSLLRNVPTLLTVSIISSLCKITCWRQPKLKSSVIVWYYKVDWRSSAIYQHLGV